MELGLIFIMFYFIWGLGAISNIAMPWYIVVIAILISCFRISSNWSRTSEFRQFKDESIRQLSHLIRMVNRSDRF